MNLGLAGRVAVVTAAGSVQRIPMGRLGEGVILFLASGMADHVTGSEYCVDGGVIRGC